MILRPATKDLCPLTVIGGFLGAGKTTLLNTLLSQAAGRYAVLVNDFGAVNVDAGLIAAHDGETMRLTNGCVCCSLNDDFIGTLLRVLSSPEKFDRIIIEASGVGDPWAIAEIALVEPGLTLDSVIVLADAECIASQIVDTRMGDTIARQIRAADIIILNKIDLVDEARRESAEARLSAIKPGVRIVPSVNAEVGPEILDAGCEGAHRTVFRAQRAMHEAQFHRNLYRRTGAFDRAKLAHALEGAPESLLRLKGFCRLGGENGPWLLQMSGARWSLTSSSCEDTEWPIELVGIALDAETDAALALRLDAARIGA